MNEAQKIAEAAFCQIADLYEAGEVAKAKLLADKTKSAFPGITDLIDNYITELDEAIKANNTKGV